MALQLKLRKGIADINFGVLGVEEDRLKCTFAFCTWRVGRRNQC